MDHGYGNEQADAIATAQAKARERFTKGDPDHHYLLTVLDGPHDSWITAETFDTPPEEAADHPIQHATLVALWDTTADGEPRLHVQLKLLDEGQAKEARKRLANWTQSEVRGNGLTVV